MATLSRKAELWKQFDGSRGLFNACYRKLLSFERANGPIDGIEAEYFLEYEAASLVNNERSKFYIYG